MIIIDSIISAVSNIAGAIKEAFSFQSKKLDMKNTDKMEQAAEAQNEVNAEDQTAKDIAERNTDAIRKDLAE